MPEVGSALRDASDVYRDTLRRLPMMGTAEILHSFDDTDADADLAWLSECASLRSSLAVAQAVAASGDFSADGSDEELVARWLPDGLSPSGKGSVEPESEGGDRAWGGPEDVPDLGDMDGGVLEATLQFNLSAMSDSPRSESRQAPLSVEDDGVRDVSAAVVMTSDLPTVLAAVAVTSDLPADLLAGLTGGDGEECTPRQPSLAPPQELPGWNPDTTPPPPPPLPTALPDVDSPLAPAEAVLAPPPPPPPPVDALPTTYPHSSRSRLPQLSPEVVAAGDPTLDRVRMILSAYAPVSVHCAVRRSAGEPESQTPPAASPPHPPVCLNVDAPVATASAAVPLPCTPKPRGGAASPTRSEAVDEARDASERRQVFKSPAREVFKSPAAHGLERELEKPEQEPPPSPPPEQPGVAARVAAMLSCIDDMAARAGLDAEDCRRTPPPRKSPLPEQPKRRRPVLRLPPAVQVPFLSPPPPHRSDPPLPRHEDPAPRAPSPAPVATPAHPPEVAVGLSGCRVERVVVTTRFSSEDGSAPAAAAWDASSTTRTPLPPASSVAPTREHEAGSTSRTPLPPPASSVAPTREHERPPSPPALPPPPPPGRTQMRCVVTPPPETFYAAPSSPQRPLSEVSLSPTASPRHRPDGESVARENADGRRRRVRRRAGGATAPTQSSAAKQKPPLQRHFSPRPHRSPSRSDPTEASPPRAYLSPRMHLSSRSSRAPRATTEPRAPPSSRRGLTAPTLSSLSKRREAPQSRSSSGATAFHRRAEQQHYQRLRVSSVDEVLGGTTRHVWAP
eukprot:Hpha_TRINITY_DN16822_c0_g7::TRINITY_DN16822_c0_g7_i1::g.149761::m.149761